MVIQGANTNITQVPIESSLLLVINTGSEYIYINNDTIVTLIRDGMEYPNAVVQAYNSVNIDGEVITLTTEDVIKLRDERQGNIVFGELNKDKWLGSKDIENWQRDFMGSGFVKKIGNITVTSGREISIPPISAFLDGIYYRNDLPSSIVIDAGDVRARKDLIILRKENNVDISYITILRGIPDLNPVPQELTQIESGIWEEAIAEITIQTNATAIAQADIKDLRILAFNKQIQQYDIGKQYWVHYLGANSEIIDPRTPLPTYGIWEKVSGAGFMRFKAEGSDEGRQTDGKQSDAIRNITGKIINNVGSSDVGCFKQINPVANYQTGGYTSYGAELDTSLVVPTSNIENRVYNEGTWELYIRIA